MWTTFRSIQPTKQAIYWKKLLMCPGPVSWPTKSCDLTALDYFFRVMWSRLTTQISSSRLTPWKNIRFCWHTAPIAAKGGRILGFSSGIYSSQPQVNSYIFKNPKFMVITLNYMSFFFLKIICLKNSFSNITSLLSNAPFI